jgi:GTP-binding protein LepA
MATRRWCSAADLIPVTEPLPARRLTPVELRELFKRGPFPARLIRNFSIIAHVDHGKTTLADAILRRTKVLEQEDMSGVGTSAVFMDKLAVERERGITVKAQTATMFIKGSKDGEEMLVNLIDTPGHIDFAYEVQRSLTASEGAVLLVDAAQGVQAQTMANFHLAFGADIAIVPALTKCDAVVDEEKIDAVAAAVEDATGFLNKEIVRTSARSAKGLEEILTRVIRVVPAPKGDPDAPLRMYLFDAWFGPHKRRIIKPGREIYEDMRTVLCNVRVVDGTVRVGDTVAMMGASAADRKDYRVYDCGILHPEPVSTGVLYAGMVGFIDVGMHSRKEANVGDTLCNPQYLKQLKPVAPFSTQQPIIFATFHPNENESFEVMREAIDKLCINDPSVTVAQVKCPAFGPGLQLGFYGQLHQSVFEDRLQSEFSLDVLVTPAQVFYKYRDADGLEHALHTSEWIDDRRNVVLLEPVVTATIVCREADFGPINSEATSQFRGEFIDSQTLDGGRLAVKFRMPLAELIRGLMERIMQLSHGFASLEYDGLTYEASDLVKVDVMVNKKLIPALSSITTKREALEVGKRIVTSLKENIRIASINLPVQALVGGKIIARETISARKKDVLSKIHAGDQSRKQKKLNEQKRGQATRAQRMVGQFSLDTEVLATVMGATKL